MKRFNPRTEIYRNGEWEDISPDVYEGDPIEMTKGRSDEGVRADPGSCSLTLLNTEGRYSPRNPRSDLYGLIGQNTPLRIREIGKLAAVREVASDTFGNRTLVDTWGSAESGQDWRQSRGTTSERDVDLGVGSVRLSGSPEANNFPRHEYLDNVLYDCEVLVKIRCQQVATGSAIGAAALLRRLEEDDYYLCLLDFRTDQTVWISVTNTTAFIGESVSTGLTYTGTSEFWLRAQVVGQTLRGRVWADGSAEPATWTIDRTITDSPIAGGNAGVATFAYSGNTNVNPAVWYSEFHATELDANIRSVTEVGKWPMKWGLSGKNSVRAPITGNGILHRLGQGKKPVRSSMYRFLSAQPAAIAYWPCEDDSGATSVASALNDAPALGMTGTADFAAFNDLKSSAHLPVMKDASFKGPVPSYDNTGLLTAHAIVHAPSGPSIEQSLIEIQTTGSVDRWDFTMTSDKAMWFHGYSAGALVVNSGLVSGVSVDSPSSIRMHLTQNGANVDWNIRFIRENGASGTEVSGTAIGHTFGVATSVVVAKNRAFTEGSIGHVYLSNDASEFESVDMLQVIQGWNEERSGNRLRRLCRDYNIPLSGIRFDESEKMGPIRVAPLPDLFDECAEADGGILYEPDRILGLEFRPRVTLYNQAPATTLDYSASHISDPFEPTPDDQHVRNDVTAKRVNGSQYRVEVTEGPLSVEDPPTGAGRYDEETELNIQTDGRLPHYAGWLAHLGTWDEERYPRVSVDLSLNASLRTSVPYLYSGQKVKITGLPEWMPPGPLEQIFRGSKETLSLWRWDVELNLTPAGPWNVFVLDDPVYGRLDTSGSEIISPVDATGTFLNVATDNQKALWTTAIADVPFDIELGGERMTVLFVENASSPQLFEVTRSVNGIVKAHPAGSRFRLAGPVAS